jgi:hypothetical protein
MELIRESAAPSHVRVFILLWCALFVGGGMVSDGFGLYIGAIHKTSAARRECASFNAERLAGFAGCGPHENFYVKNVNDGIGLLNAKRRPGDSVLSLDFANPFSYALNMAPMRGGVNSQAFATTYDWKYKPSSEKMFGSATLVMFPKYFADLSSDGVIDKIYGPFLEAHFDLAGESDAWRLYRRKPGQPAMY